MGKCMTGKHCSYVRVHRQRGAEYRMERPEQSGLGKGERRVEDVSRGWWRGRWRKREREGWRMLVVVGGGEGGMEGGGRGRPFFISLQEPELRL